MRGVFLAIISAAFLGLSACGQSIDGVEKCSAAPANQGAGTTGTAFVFSPDPSKAAKNPNLSSLSDLDPYRTSVQLEHLDGNGVLQGQYVEARTDAGGCQAAFGAQSKTNDFEYPEKDPRFQEAMVYYYGDRYQAALQNAGIEVASKPILILAHCMQKDNAFYKLLRYSDGTIEEQVCLGDSVTSKGAHYADDAYVTVHELQHATTARHYSLTQWLGQFPYDEAGALNEGISDFMALMYLAPLVPKDAGFDPRIFSAWALGTFGRNMQTGIGVNSARGAHKCPMYDPSWPNCDAFPNFTSLGKISYSYPDGLGWPYADNPKYPVSTRDMFVSFPAQEEIHNNAVIIEGALWDVYQGLVAADGLGDLETDSSAQVRVQNQMMRLVVKAIEDLPKPDSQNLSPVNFYEFASSLLHVAKAMDLTVDQLDAVTSALQARGLIGAPQLDSHWAVAGSGEPQTSGMFVVGNTVLMRQWLKNSGADPELVKNNGTGMNLAPGKPAVVWFNLQNDSLSGVSAGGVNLTVTSLNPSVTFSRLGNPGWISNSKLQIQYAKVNGSGVVQDLVGLFSGNRITIGKSYFQTNPHFAFWDLNGVLPSFSTGIWVQVAGAASHGDVAQFQVEAKPANGAASVVTFNATIQ